MYVCKLEDNFRVSIPTLPYGFKDQIQVTELGSKDLYLLSHFNRSLQAPQGRSEQLTLPHKPELHLCSRKDPCGCLCCWGKAAEESGRLDKADPSLISDSINYYFLKCQFPLLLNEDHLHPCNSVYLWVCGSLNENGFQRLMFEHLVPSWRSCPGRIRRWSLVERGVSLGVNFEVSKTMPFP